MSWWKSTASGLFSLNLPSCKSKPITENWFNLFRPDLVTAVVVHWSSNDTGFAGLTVTIVTFCQVYMVQKLAVTCTMYVCIGNVCAIIGNVCAIICVSAMYVLCAIICVSAMYVLSFVYGCRYTMIAYTLLVQK